MAIYLLHEQWADPERRAESADMCYKIGYTGSSGLERVGSLSTGNPRLLVPVGLIDVGRAHERPYQCQFDQFRVPGTREWFYPDPSILEFFDRHPFRVVVLHKSIPAPPGLPEYEIGDGGPVLVLWRATADSPSYDCPLCGRRHHHGHTEGHRSARCHHKTVTALVASDGTQLPTSGYAIRTICHDQMAVACRARRRDDLTFWRFLLQSKEPTRAAEFFHRTWKSGEFRFGSDTPQGGCFHRTSWGSWFDRCKNQELVALATAAWDEYELHKMPAPERTREPVFGPVTGVVKRITGSIL